LADIFREIDEDLRRDRMIRLWQRHGRHIIIAAILIVAATAAYVLWDDHRHRQNEALGLRYSQAAELAQADATKAVPAFETLAADAGAGYATLSRLQAAMLKAKGSDKAGGVAALKAIADDSGVDQPYRDLALLLSVSFSADDATPADIEARLQPLTAPSNAWRFSALELTALARLKAGDKAGAVKSYQQLADDQDAPPSLRARATEIVGALSH
jgi:hypothetical protein